MVRSAGVFTPGLSPAGAAYFLFAVGYFAYMTYSVALLVGLGAGTETISAFWSVLGLAAVLAPAIWSGPIARWHGATSLSVLLLVVASGAALPLLTSSVVAVLFSGVLFGGSFLSVVAAVTAVIRRILPPEEWDAGIAALTVVFAAGQIVGPLLTGFLAERGGGLGWSAAVLVLGALAATMQSRRARMVRPAM